MLYQKYPVSPVANPEDKKLKTPRLIADAGAFSRAFPGTEVESLSQYFLSGLKVADAQRRWEQSTGERRAQGLEIVPDSRFAVGVSVMETRLRLAADLRLNELAYREAPFADISRLPEQTAAVRQALESFLEDSQLERGRLLGVGITIPGIVTPECDRIVMAPTLHLTDTPLDGLTRDIPYPVFIENDASSSGYAEWFARGGQQNMAYFSLENGVGGAVLHFVREFVYSV